MSLRRYEAFDLGALTLIAAVLEALNTYAFFAFGTSATFTLSIAAAVGMLAIFRWNLPGVVVAPIAGLASLLVRLLVGEEVTINLWIGYTVGYLGLAACLLWFKFLPKEDIRKKWLYLAGFAITGYLAIDVVRTLSYLGSDYFLQAARFYFSWDLFNCLFAFFILLIASKQANLLVDMKEYVSKIANNPNSAIARQEQNEKNKLEGMSESSYDLNEAALLDGGTLSPEELKALQAPFDKERGKTSIFDEENKALKEYRDSKEKKQSSNSSQDNKKGKD